MRCATIAVVAALACAAGAVAQEHEPPELVALMSVSLDGSAEAQVSEGEVTVTGGEGLEFVEGRAGQGVNFAEGDFIEYRGIPALDPKSGTVEVWVKPDFSERDLEDHYYLRLVTEDGSGGLDISFASLHCGPRAWMWDGERVTNTHADFVSFEGKWNHLVVTWDHYNPDMWSLRLYVNGRVRAYRDFGEMPVPTVMIVGRKSAEETTNAKAVIDEIALYNRCLTEMQVLALYEAVAEGPGKLEVIRERVAADDAEWARRMDLIHNHRKLGMVVGRTISGWNDSLFTDLLKLPIPERIDEKDIETTDLSQYDALIFPGGGGFALTEEGAEALRQYVRGGGGFVGVCAGCYASEKYGLLEREISLFRERGRCEVTLRPHPITEGFHPTRKLDLPHANGPLIAPGDEAEDVVVYNIGKPKYVCVVARNYGEGRMAAFSAHPEGENEARPLVRNAILWAAWVIGVDEE